MTLDPVQLRVLGALIEKEITTPEYYPLSLNSLIAACNQKSSRDPVMDLSEGEVLSGVNSLEDLGLVSTVRESRVPKYEHRVRTVLNLRRDETAVICLLLLRGAQTPGELRARADRLYSFDGIEAVEATLSRLGAQAPEEDAGRTERPLVVQMARQPGAREARYMHLLGGPVEAAASGTNARRSEGGASGGWMERVTQIEEEVASLRTELARMRLVLKSAGILQEVDDEKGTEE